MLSIGIFTYSTKPRGSVVHATYLAEALERRGHDVTLYALSKAGDLLYREVGCRVVYLDARRAPADPDALIAQRVQEVAAGVADLRPRHDAYHAEDCLVASGLLAKKAELGLKPLVRTLHHLEHFASPYLRDCQRRSILDADVVACVSQVSQRDVRRELGCSCPVIGNGVDFARFASDSALQERTRERFRIASSDRVVLSVGGVEPRKNSFCSLEAMVPLLRAQPNLRWVIAGGASIWEHDAYRSGFRDRLGRLEPSVRERVVELGPVTEAELTGLYGISQVLLCPSLQEGFGLCVLEALSAGVAAVVSDAEPFTEYLTREVACFVRPGSPASIGEGVSLLLRDEQQRLRLAQAGKEHARSFSWERVAIEHERLYRSAIYRATRRWIPTREELAHA
jgi:glycosyltransferase-like protein